MFIRLFAACSVALFLLLHSACEQADATGTLDLRMTNTLMPDDSVQGVYITISEIYVDGELFGDWTSPRLVNLLDLQQDTSFLVGIAPVIAKTHNHIRMILNNIETPTGESPGCFVQRYSGAKFPLSNSPETEWIASNMFTIPYDGGDFVSIEINLRKAIQKEASGTYRWRDATVLRESFRSFSLRHSGLVKGTCNIPSSLQDSRIILHGYLKGSYLGPQETIPDASGLTFENALVSTSVNADGSYILGYVPESQLLLLVARYTLVNGEWTFHSFLQAEAYNSSNQEVSTFNIAIAPGTVNTIRLEL